MVCCYPEESPETSYPVVQESTRNRFGGDVHDKDGLRPAGEPVHTGQHENLSMAGWQGANDVQVDTIKARIWSG